MIDDTQAEKLQLTLATSGWRDVMYPALVARGNQAVKALTLSRTERAAALKGTDFDTEDDVLRAIIRDVNWMMVCWTNELSVWRHNRQLDELGRQESNAGAITANQ